MRSLTFTGYLNSYVRELAGEQTLALAKLVDRARVQPRLREPLALWAVKTGRGNRLRKLADWDTSFTSELDALFALEECGELDRALAERRANLRDEYLKVWTSYSVRAGATARDATLKQVARQRVLDAEKKSRVSRYRMAKDLGLNPGNLHAFLAQGNVQKLSLDRALELVRYVEAA